MKTNTQYFSFSRNVRRHDAALTKQAKLFRGFIYKLHIRLLVTILIVLNAFTGAAQTISQDYTGLWMNDRSRTEEEKPMEGVLNICPDGKVYYQVFSNQLQVTFKVKQTATKNFGAYLDFYFEEAEVGAGMSNVRFPAKGTLVAKAELTQEFQLSFKYLTTSFIQTIRNNSSLNAAQKLKVFPSAFYYNSRAISPCVPVITE
jgi:hypothetical protein